MIFIIPTERIRLCTAVICGNPYPVCKKEFFSPWDHSLSFQSRLFFSEKHTNVQKRKQEVTKVASLTNNDRNLPSVWVHFRFFFLQWRNLLFYVIYITKTCLFKYSESFTTKKWKFSDSHSDIFHMFAQNIDCWYSLDLPRRGSSNGYPQSMFLSKNKKNNVYPVNPSFTIKKWGLRGSKLYRRVLWCMIRSQYGILQICPGINCNHKMRRCTSSSYNISCAPREDSDQPAHPRKRRMIWVFANRT